MRSRLSLVEFETEIEEVFYLIGISVARTMECGVTGRFTELQLRNRACCLYCFQKQPKCSRQKLGIMICVQDLGSKGVGDPPEENLSLQISSLKNSEMM